MPIDITKENVPLGEVVFQWTIKEFNRYARSARWYWLSALLGIGLLVYAIWTTNYLFSLIIVLFAMILIMHEVQEPSEVPFAILKTGVVIGKKYYKFSEISNFWMIYNPPDVKVLYFALPGVVRHRLQVPLLDYDPRPIRDFLQDYLTEDVEVEDEPFTDRLARLFQIH